MANGQSSLLSTQNGTKTNTGLSVDLSTLMFEVHLTGDIPYTGMFRVLPGTRADELISTAHEAWKLKESQILISPSGLTDPNQDVPVDAFSDVLRSELDLRNITITKRNGAVISADLISYRLGGNLSSNPVLDQGDVINIRKLSQDPLYVSISGAVNTPITIPFRAEETALHLLTIAGGKSAIASEDEILVYRLSSTGNSVTNPSDAESSTDGLNRRANSGTSEISGDSFTALSLTSDQLAGFALEPGDRIIIPVNHKKRVIHHVNISGEVERPGTYPIIEGTTTLADIFTMAGGPTKQALLNAIEISRNSVPDAEYTIIEGEFQPLPDLFRVSDQFEESRVLLQNQLMMENNLIYADLSGLFGMASSADQESASGMKAAFNDGLPLYNLDEIHVPKDQNTIRILGQIGVPGFYPFDSDLSYLDYIDKASGLSPAADSSRIFVIKAATNNWIPVENATLSSGDILFVDSRPLGSYVLSQDLEIRKIDLDLRRQLQENDKKRVNLQIIVSVVNVSVSLVTTYLLIRRQ